MSYTKFPSKPIHIVVDLETKATCADAAILSIGAAHAKNSTEPPVCFSIGVNEQCLDNVLRYECPETMAWWDKQSPEARQVAFSGTENLETALKRFSQFCHDLCEGDFSRIVLWGNGPEFDLAILADAYTQLNVPYPFDFRNQHSLRTITALHNMLGLTRPAILKNTHIAVEDAYAELNTLLQILDELEPYGD